MKNFQGLTPGLSAREWVEEMNGAACPNCKLPLRSGRTLSSEGAPLFCLRCDSAGACWGCDVADGSRLVAVYDRGIITRFELGKPPARST